MLTNVAHKKLWLEVSGDGPAVVMIHGLGGTTTFYEAVEMALSATHRVIRYDFNGHGRSPLTGSVSIASLADDLGAVMDELGVESADIIGHSAGTIVVQEFAARNPDRAAKLVLLGPIRELPDAGRDGLRARAGTVRSDTIGAVAGAVAAAGTGPATKSDRPEIVGYVRESVLSQTDEGYAVACEAAADSVDADQSKIAGPVLVITGSADGICPPEKAEHIASGFADARVEVIDGIGHWTVVEAGKQVSTMIADFLK
jgi:3-oxoadipate enol-lactonase